MEFSSSEDDELIEEFVDQEEDIPISDVDQRSNEVAMPLHFFEHGENSMVTVDSSIDNDLLSASGDLKSEDPYIGMEFESDSAARVFYNAYALRLGFGIRVARSRTERRKGVEVLVMKRFVCLKEGYHKKKATDYTTKKKRKRLSIRDGCPAMMEVVRRPSGRWTVTKLVVEHTHIVVSPERIRDIQLNRLTGKERERDNHLREMRQKVFGDDTQGFLEHLKKAQAVNSGFFYAIQVDSRNCMTNVFWADARARLSFGYFADAVTFDTSYKKNEKMFPLATFTGVNHHGQPVNFGCALVLEKTESSLCWLFETWLNAMYGHQPHSITTDQGNAVTVAVAKVFPNSRHRLCKWSILSRCKKKLFDVYSNCPTFHGDFKKCVIECETPDAFEECWQLILDKYNLMDNTWLQSIYNARHKWIPAYLKDSFFAELAPTQRVESTNRFFRKNFDLKTTLQAFIDKFDQAIDDWYEKEAQEDFASLHCQQILKTSSPMEKQAASIYTRAVFEKFQVELIEAFGHYALKILDGPLSKYSVEKDGDGRNRHFVAFNASEKKGCCSCFKFESSGILCRHVLGVILLNGGILIPEHYILKRWTRKAKTGLVSVDHRGGVDVQNYNQTSPMMWYNDLVQDAMKFAAKGSTSPEAYKIAKEMLQKVFAEIVDVERGIAKSEYHQ